MKIISHYALITQRGGGTTTKLLWLLPLLKNSGFLRPTIGNTGHKVARVWTRPLFRAGLLMFTVKWTNTYHLVLQQLKKPQKTSRCTSIFFSLLLLCLSSSKLKPVCGAARYFSAGRELFSSPLCSSEVKNSHALQWSQQSCFLCLITHSQIRIEPQLLWCTFVCMCLHACRSIMLLQGETPTS